MRSSRLSLALCLAAALSGCGGGGATSPTPSPSSSTPTPSAPTPTPTTAGCSLAERQDWAQAQLNEWYLFPDLLAQGVNKGAYASLGDYVDALVAPARAQSKDRHFTYVTSIAEENALINSGATAGFGFRLGYDTAGQRVFVIESFEGAPALGQNIDRGDEILAIGGQTVTSLMNSGGPYAVIDALGPDTPGTSRMLRIQDFGGAQRDVTLTKADYAMTPVSARYGVKLFDSAGSKIGYINLRSFIVSSAETDLKNAFQQFKAQGVTKVIVDLRYNGGGLVSLAELMGDLMAAGRTGQVLSYTSFRDSKASLNRTTTFTSQSQAIAPLKIAFIGTPSSASASELLMNTFPPYLGNNVALVGGNTYGKPVGQIAQDLTACDDRLRVIAFKTDNADHQGGYFTGLAATMPVTCSANDDITHQLGDPGEAMIAASLSWLGGASCSAISSTGKTTQGVKSGRLVLQPERPNAAQHDIPGLY